MLTALPCGMYNCDLTMLTYCKYMQSLSGHTSPVESVAFDSGEVLVLGGASSGVIRLWDLEEAKSKLILVHDSMMILGYTII